MHACSSRVVGKFHRDASPHPCLQLISETCTKLQKAETPPWEGHRPVISMGDHLPTTLCGGDQRGWSACQKIWSADQFPPLVSGVSATKARERKGNVFSTNVCMTTLPVIAQALGSVVLDPRAINHASRCIMAEESNCTTQWDMNAHISN